MLVRPIVVASTLIVTLAALADDPPALDDRIDDAKITESALPPLPGRVVMPMPPEHRISRDASTVPMDADLHAKALEAIDEGIAFLCATQDQRGLWMADAAAAPSDDPDRPSPVATAVTALCVRALMQSATGDVRRDEHIARAVQIIFSTQNEDGSFEGGALTNYVTSTVVSALAASGVDEVGDDLANATAWLQTSQWDDGEGLSPKQDWYGGAGYGNRGRPDMSNTQMMLEALYDSGLSPDEPAFQRALTFASRTQNLKATNPSEWAGDDGGFVYTPANGGESMASEFAGEGRHAELIPAGQARSLRSYGSMTYAGFKSLIYAGLDPDDVRVRAAFDWIRKHWTFDENPGVGQQGLYYYYHAMARCLRVAQQNVITGADGVDHNWRNELVEALLDRQNDDGSWINTEDRWLEGNASLATAYAVLALQEVVKPVRASDAPTQP